MEQQARFIKETGRLPLEMGVFTANHFVVVNNLDEGNISAVRAFNIEKEPQRITEEINRLIDNESDKISSSVSLLIEEARTRLPNGFDYSSNPQKRGAGMRNAGMGERQQPERGGDNALDRGTHVEHSEEERNGMVERAEALGAKLGTAIRVVDDVESLQHSDPEVLLRKTVKVYVLVLT